MYYKATFVTDHVPHTCDECDSDSKHKCLTFIETDFSAKLAVCRFCILVSTVEQNGQNMERGFLAALTNCSIVVYLFTIIIIMKLYCNLFA